MKYIQNKQVWSGHYRDIDWTVIIQVPANFVDATQLTNQGWVVTSLRLVQLKLCISCQPQRSRGMTCTGVTMDKCFRKWTATVGSPVQDHSSSPHILWERWPQRVCVCRDKCKCEFLCIWQMKILLHFFLGGNSYALQNNSNTYILWRMALLTQAFTHFQVLSISPSHTHALVSLPLSAHWVAARSLGMTIEEGKKKQKLPRWEEGCHAAMATSEHTLDNSINSLLNINGANTMKRRGSHKNAIYHQLSIRWKLFSISNYGGQGTNWRRFTSWIFMRNLTAWHL